MRQADRRWARLTVLLVLMAGLCGTAAGASNYGDGVPTELVAQAAPILGLLEAGQWVEVRAECERGYAAATSDELRVVYLRGIAESYKREHSSQVVAAYQDIITRFPNSVQISWVKYGLIEAEAYTGARIGNEQAADTVLKLSDEFLAAYPHHELTARILWMRGQTYRLGKHHDTAAYAEYLKGVEQYGGQEWASNCLIECMTIAKERRQDDTVISLGKRYLTTYGKRVEVQLDLANAYLGRGDRDQAVIEYTKLADTYPADQRECAFALYQVAMSRQAAGQRDLAKAGLQNVIDRYPDQPWAAQAKLRLAELAQQQ